MRASARTRVTFVPAKVTKTIRSGTPSFRFPAFLATCGAKRTCDLRSLKHLSACSAVHCGTSVAPSRSWHPFHSFRRSSHCGRILGREVSTPADEVEQSGIIPLLARRASQSLTGDKRGVFERSELASACQGKKRRAAFRPR